MNLVSKLPLSTRQSASSLIVLTWEDIQASGYTSLSEVLQLVPGLSLTLTEQGVFQTASRGLYSQSILFLINGQRVNSLLSGMAEDLFDTMSVSAIYRIEILKSPSASFYGDRAFSGVINIVTGLPRWKTGVHVHSVLSPEISQYGFTSWYSFLGVEAKSLFSTHRYRGYPQRVLSDLQHERDLKQHTTASLVPGNARKDETQLQFIQDMRKGAFRFLSATVIKRRNGFIGYGYSLNDETDIRQWGIYNQGLWTFSPGAYTDAQLKLTHQHSRDDQFLELYPEGAISDTVIYDGVNEAGFFQAQALGLELSLQHEWTYSHHSLMGVLYESQRIIDARFFTNYYRSLMSDQLQEYFPLDTANRHRYIRAGYFHHQWIATPKTTFLGGLRLDHLNDSPAHLSPRLGMIWEFSPPFYLKAFLGTAFMRPTFQELYAVPNGNPELGIQKEFSQELTLGGKTERMSGTATLASTTYSHLIEPDDDFIFQNTPSFTLNSLELIGQYHWRTRHTFSQSLSLFHAPAETEVTLAPAWQGLTQWESRWSPFLSSLIFSTFDGDSLQGIRATVSSTFRLHSRSLNRTVTLRVLNWFNQKSTYVNRIIPIQKPPFTLQVGLTYKL